MEKNKKPKENTLLWKLIIVLLLLFAVVIWFKGEYDKKEIYEYYSDCMLKKNLCNGAVNETLIEWKKCIFAVGGLMDMTDKEIEAELDDSNPFYLNLNSTGGNK